MVRIRRFGIVRTSTVVALLYVVVIAIIFVPVAVLVAIASPASTTTATGTRVGAVEILVFGLVIALVYGLVGWIFTAIACALYNLVARMVGGIEIQLEAVAPPPPAPVWGPTSLPPAPPQAPGPPATSG